MVFLAETGQRVLRRIRARLLKARLLAGGDELRDVGHEARRYLVFVASHLACLSRHQGKQVCLGGVVSPFRIYYTPQVTSNAAKRYTGLQHKDQLRSAL